jgi:hypothetical protein
MRATAAAKITERLTTHCTVFLALMLEAAADAASLDPRAFTFSWLAASHALTAHPVLGASARRGPSLADRDCFDPLQLAR